MFAVSRTMPGPRGGYSTMFCTGMLRPEVQTLTLSYTDFDRKGTPFIYLSLKMVPLSYTFQWKWYPFQRLYVRLFDIFWKAIFIILKWQFSLPFLCFIGVASLPFPILREIPTLSYTSTREIPTLSYTSSLKKVPLSGGASPYSPL